MKRRRPDAVQRAADIILDVVEDFPESIAMKAIGYIAAYVLALRSDQVFEAWISGVRDARADAIKHRKGQEQ